MKLWANLSRLYPVTRTHRNFTRAVAAAALACAMAAAPAISHAATHNPAIHHFSVASASAPNPDGQIVITRGDAENYLAHAYVVNPDGTGEHLLFPGVAGKTWWAPDGQMVSVPGDGALTIVNTLTGASRNYPVPDPDFACGPTTTSDQCANTDFSCGPWSPDATRVACHAGSGVNPSRNGIYTIRTSDGQGLRLVTGCPPACSFELGDWSPNGRSIVFANDNPDGTVSIDVVSLDGRHLRALTPPDMLVDDSFGGRWSANGNQIVFAAHPTADNRNALYAVRSDGSDLHQLPIPDCGGAYSDPNSVGCPEADWSPDGQHLVYTRRTAAGENAWTFDLATGLATQLSPPGATQDGYPSWGPPAR